MLTHILAFAAGAALVYMLRRPAEAVDRPQIGVPASPASAPGADPMLATDLDLDAAIIEYITENQVFHINDICAALEHPKGSRFVRAHFHQLMEQGKIRYRNMLYTI